MLEPRHHLVKIAGPSAEDTDVSQPSVSGARPLALAACLLGLGGCVDLGHPDLTCAALCDGGMEDTAGNASPDGGASTRPDAGVTVGPDAAGGAGPEAGADGASSDAPSGDASSPPPADGPGSDLVTAPPADAFEPAPDLAKDHTIG